MPKIFRVAQGLKEGREQRCLLQYTNNIKQASVAMDAFLIAFREQVHEFVGLKSQ